MIGVYITIALVVITWIFWSAMDYYYRKNPLKLYKIKHEKRLSSLEIIELILRTLSIMGMAYSVVYMFITWK